jgi:hypothetical protein
MNCIVISRNAYKFNRSIRRFRCVSIYFQKYKQFFLLFSLYLLRPKIIFISKLNSKNKSVIRDRIKLTLNTGNSYWHIRTVFCGATWNLSDDQLSKNPPYGKVIILPDDSLDACLIRCCQTSPVLQMSDEHARVNNLEAEIMGAPGSITGSNATVCVVSTHHGISHLNIKLPYGNRSVTAVCLNTLPL